MLQRVLRPLAMIITTMRPFASKRMLVTTETDGFQRIPRLRVVV
jgi:hypothetical protein